MTVHEQRMIRDILRLLHICVAIIHYALSRHSHLFSDLEYKGESCKRLSARRYLKILKQRGLLGTANSTMAGTSFHDVNPFKVQVHKYHTCTYTTC